MEGTDLTQLGSVAASIGLFISTPANLVINWFTISYPQRPLWVPFVLGFFVSYGLALLIPIATGGTITGQVAAQSVFAAFTALAGSAAINAIASTAKDKVQEVRSETK